MEWKVLKSESDYNKAITRTEELFDLEPGNDGFDELELLLLLVKDYEDKFYPMPMPDPIEVIKLKMEELGMKNKDLIPIIGSEGHVSSILSGRRKITLDMARSIAKLLQIPSYIFINEHIGLEDYSPENANITGNYLKEQLDRYSERIVSLHALSTKKQSSLTNGLINPQVSDYSGLNSADRDLSSTVQKLYEAITEYKKEGK